MARNAAAMPQPVAMNCRRLRPSFLPFSSASSRIRRSTRFCVSLWVGGRYSPLETIWVGMGVAAEAVSAPATRRCSRSLSQLPILVLPVLIVVDVRSLDLAGGSDNAWHPQHLPDYAAARLPMVRFSTFPFPAECGQRVTRAPTLVNV